MSKSYNDGVIAIHWITLVLLIIAFVSGKYMEGQEPYEITGTIKSHIIIGLLVLLLTIIRSFMYVKFERPDPIKTKSELNDKLIVWIHKAFYYLLYGIVLTGMATVIFGGYMAFFITEIPLDEINRESYFLVGHNLLTILTILFIVLHVVGVVKHYIFTKENTLKRIS